MEQLKSTPKSLMPRERLLREGATSLSNIELLMVILQSGNRNCSVDCIASEILKKSDNLKNLVNMSFCDLTKIKGLNIAKAATLIASCELYGRLIRPVKDDFITLSNVHNVMKWFQYSLGSLEQEVLVVIFLNKQHQLIDFAELFRGTVDRSIVHPRDVFREAIRHNSCSIIMIHNHPGGSLIPSEQDIVLTKHLIKTGEMLEIYLDDHLIVTKRGYISLRSDVIKNWEE